MGVGQRRALLDAEAVLLVDHREGQPAELDVRLEQRVGADHEPRVARRQALEARPLLTRRDVAREQLDVEAERLDQLAHGVHVLVGQGLGRGHQRALGVVLDGPQQRVQGDDGLARADVPEQQAVHRAASAQVGVDRPDRAALAGRSRNGSESR